MLKIVMIGLLLFGAYMGFTLFLPSSGHIAFHLGSFPIPWFALGLVVVGYAGWKTVGK